MINDVFVGSTEFTCRFLRIQQLSVDSERSSRWLLQAISVLFRDFDSPQLRLQVVSSHLIDQTSASPESHHPTEYYFILSQILNDSIVMILRIRSPDGTFRLDVQPTDSGESFGEKILDTIPNDPPVLPETITLSNKPAGGETVPLNALQGRKIGDMGFSHGDLIFLSYKTGSSAPAQPSPGPSSEPISAVPGASSTTPSSATKPTATSKAVREDAVDDYWRSKDGKIHRKRDEKMCRHGGKGMCDYCMPLEPYDMAYQAEHQIKHLSYHAYLRKLESSNSTAQSSASYLPPLTPLDYKVAVPCTSGSHAPWPAGICSKCQPSAITLQAQPFRMVDHVEFASPDLIDNFLTAWRRTGQQRFGLLVGRYEPYEIVPMGIKAVVEAVHEVEQEGEVDGLTIGDNLKEEEQRIKQRAEWCEKGLKIVGMLYTDLTPQEEDRSKVLCKRHSQSYFLSSLEAIFSAQQQMKHPNPSKSSPTGSFSSRFVTCILTGTEEGGVDLMAFQVNEQGVAMVEADMIEASVDPSTVRVKQEEGERYIPDVFHSYKNEYGLTVKESAKPSFPVEYLLVNVTHGFPTAPNPLFRSHGFPIENRPGLHDQSLDKVVETLRTAIVDARSPPEEVDAMTDDELERLEKWLNDWHLYYYLTQCGLIEEADARALARCVTFTGGITDETREQNRSVMGQLFNSGGWRNLMAAVKESAAEAPANSSAGHQFSSGGFEEIPAHLLDEINGVVPASNPSGESSSGERRSNPTSSGFIDVDEEIPEELAGDIGGSGSGARACPHCTFENPAGTSDCEVCGLPLNV